MRLNEISDSEMALALARDIEKNCQPFLTTSGVTLYRGMFISDDKPYELLTTHKDRQPADASKPLTAALNTVYKRYGSPVTRHNAVFTYAREEEAGFYARVNDGKVYVIFPIGEFDALWNNAIDDPFNMFDEGYAPEVFSYPPETEIQINIEATEDFKNIVTQEFYLDKDSQPSDTSNMSSSEFDGATMNIAKKRYEDYTKTIGYRTSLATHIQELKADADTLDTHGFLDAEKLWDEYGDEFHSDLATEHVNNVEVLIKVDKYYAVTSEFYDKHVRRHLNEF